MGSTYQWSPCGSQASAGAAAAEEVAEASAGVAEATEVELVAAAVDDASTGL